MKRILVTASHHKMADGLKDTLNFVSGGVQETIALSAYLDNQPVEEAVDELMKGFAEEDEVIKKRAFWGHSTSAKRCRRRPSSSWAEAARGAPSGFCSLTRGKSA